MRALVLVLDCLHLGYLGCYGNDWVATPALDALAAEAVVFDQHVADRPDPAGAWHALRTGRYDPPLPDDATPLPSNTQHDLVTQLRQSGVHTRLVGGEVSSEGWDHAQK